MGYSQFEFTSNFFKSLISTVYIWNWKIWKFYIIINKLIISVSCWNTFYSIRVCTPTRMSSMFILSNMYEFNLTLEKFYNMAIVAVEYVFLMWRQQRGLRRPILRQLGSSAPIPRLATPFIWPYVTRAWELLTCDVDQSRHSTCPRTVARLAFECICPRRFCAFVVISVVN